MISVSGYLAAREGKRDISRKGFPARIYEHRPFEIIFLLGVGIRRDSLKSGNNFFFYNFPFINNIHSNMKFFFVLPGQRNVTEMKHKGW